MIITAQDAAILAEAADVLCSLRDEVFETSGAKHDRNTYWRAAGRAWRQAYEEEQ